MQEYEGSGCANIKKFDLKSDLAYESKVTYVDLKSDLAYESKVTFAFSEVQDLD